MRFNCIPKLLLTIALLVLSKSANAYDCEIDGIFYYRISASELEVANKVFSDQNRSAYSGSVTIPASVTYNGKTFNVVSIGEYAFRDCTGLTAITIPNSIRSIKGYAFYNCSQLSSITIPATVTEIGEGAFEGCASVTQMVLPEGISSIEDELFFGCVSMRSVVIPSSVASIGENSFSRCSSLISIYCQPTSAPSCEHNAFAKVDRTWCTLYVPKDAKSYEEDPEWKSFFIEAMPDKIDVLISEGSK